MRQPLALGALVILACGTAHGALGTPRAADDRPRLDGRLVLDVPIARASADARHVWEEAERLRADRGPVAPDGLSLEEYTAWMRDTWGAWLGDRVRAMQDLRARFVRLADGPPNERVLAAVVAGYLYEDLARIIEGLPLPEEVSANREMAASFASELRRQAAPAYRRARESWELCADAVVDAPDELRGWRSTCESRLAELPEVPEEAPEGDAAAVIPEECERERFQTREPSVVATGAHPYALFVASNGALSEPERDRLADAMQTSLRRRMGKARILSPREVRAARELAATSSIAPGRVCARAPSAVDVLRRREPTLERIRAFANCYSDFETPTCTLLVELGEGPDADRIWANMNRVSFDARAWTALVGRLGESDSLVVEGRGAGRPFPSGGPRVAGIELQGAWDFDDGGEARPESVLAAIDFAACRDRGGTSAAPVRLLLEVSDDGAVTRASAETGPASAARTTCVVDAARAAHFAPATGPRRAELTVEFLPSDLVRLDYRARVPDDTPPELHADEALEDWTLRDAIARCYAPLPDSSARMSSYRATLAIAPDGTVTDAPVVPAHAPRDDAGAVASCIAAALANARFGCTPGDAESQLEVTLCVGTQPR